MKLCRCACGCSAAPLLRSRSAPFRAELRAVRTFAAGAPASDRSAHSVPAGSRTGSVGGALNRIAFGLRRSGKIPFGMLPSDRVQAGNPFGDRRCGKIPPLSRRTVSINRAQSRTGVRALPRQERRPWENERSLLVASHRRPRLRMRVAPKGICRTVPPRSRKGAGRPRRRGLDWDLRSCSGTENGPAANAGRREEIFSRKTDVPLFRGPCPDPIRFEVAARSAGMPAAAADGTRFHSCRRAGAGGPEPEVHRGVSALRPGGAKFISAGEPGGPGIKVRTGRRPRS